MHTTHQQDQLIDYAAHHWLDAEPCDEGDVIVYCDSTVPRADGSLRTTREAEHVATMPALRRLLGH